MSLFPSAKLHELGYVSRYDVAQFPGVYAGIAAYDLLVLLIVVGELVLVHVKEFLRERLDLLRFYPSHGTSSSRTSYKNFTESRRAVFSPRANFQYLRWGVTTFGLLEKSM